MKCCDSCKFFVLMPGKRLLQGTEGRWGWCNASLPQWADEVRHYDSAQSALKPTDGKVCKVYVSSTTAGESR